MDQNFQTSFIPKKPLIEKRATVAQPVNVFAILGIFVLFAVLIATGALFFYKSVLDKTLIQKNADLELAKNRFEPSKITQLQLLDKRLNAASQVLANHVAVTPIFEALSAATLKGIRYTDFSYSIGSTNDTSKISVQLKGTADGYGNIALQSDLLAQNKNLIEPVFSNLTLDDRGGVTFDLNFSVNKSFIDYKKVLQAQS